MNGTVKRAMASTIRTATPMAMRMVIAGAPAAGPAATRRRAAPLRRMRGAEVRQRQVGHDARGGRRLVQDDLVGVLEHALHRLDIKTPRRHILRRLVGFVDGEEARGVALRLQHHPLLVGLRFLHDARRVAAGDRDHVVAIGLGLVDQAIEIDLGALDVAEGGVDLVGGRGLLQHEVDDLDAAAVAVENVLHQVLVSLATFSRPSVSALASWVARSPRASRFPRRP